ncbi:MAG: hypothetical protein V1722_03945 [Candidatus Micrarchaeota archaeon]
MSSMSTSQMIIGLCALVALFLNIQWLFLSMLLLFGALFAAESLQERPNYAHHSSEKYETKHEQPSPGFLDPLIANLTLNQFEINNKREKKDAEKLEAAKAKRWGKEVKKDEKEEKKDDDKK